MTVQEFRALRFGDRIRLENEEAEVMTNDGVEISVRWIMTGAVTRYPATETWGASVFAPRFERVR